MILRPEADHINLLNLWGRFAQNLSKIVFKIFQNYLFKDFHYDFLMILRPEADHINFLNLWVASLKIFQKSF